MTTAARGVCRLTALTTAALVFAGCGVPGTDAAKQASAPAAVAKSDSAPPTAKAPRATKTIELMDTTWPGKPMAFATIRIPADWQATGGIAVRPRPPEPRVLEPQSVSLDDDPYANDVTGLPLQCQSMPLTCLEWSAGRSDGSQGILVLPSTTWFVDVPPARKGTPARPSMVEASLRELAVLLHPGARVITFAPGNVAAPDNSNPPAFQTRWESGRLVVAYPANGRDMRADLTMVLLINEDQAPPRGRRRLVVTRNPPIVVHAAAADFAVLETERIRTSMVVAPAWFARLNAFNKAREATRQPHLCDQAIYHPRPPGCDRILPPD